jgi:Uma2 family endonuclease
MVLDAELRTRPPRSDPVSMALETVPRTRAEVLALSDDGCRHELVGGVHLVTPAPSPRHQAVLAALYDALRPHVERHHLGRLFWSPADLTFGDDEVLQPDLFLLPIASVPERWDSAPVPRLVIEVVSPGSALADRQHKRLRCQRAGVADYWVVDPEQRQVEVWHPAAEAGEVWRERMTWRVPVGEVIVIDLEAIFG